jgi:hypothetical protein
MLKHEDAFRIEHGGSLLIYADEFHATGSDP